MNTLYYGDNLNILRDYFMDESVDLIYLDPPFNSNRKSDTRCQNTFRLFLSLMPIWVLVWPIHAQVANKTVSALDFSFEVPARWRVADKSTDQLQQFNVVPEAGNVLIIISAYKAKVKDGSGFQLLKDQVSKPRQGKIAAGFSHFTEKAECVQAMQRKIPGQRISGKYGQESTTSSSFSFVENGRFMHLLYLREDRAASAADAGWQTILSTLKVQGGGREKELWLLDRESDEFLNGKAIELPKPIHSSSTSSNGSGSDVIVSVLIDEKGDVVWTKATSGDPGFYYSAIQAAKKAKFMPFKVCGEVSQVHGTIRYRFLPAR